MLAELLFGEKVFFLSKLLLHCGKNTTPRYFLCLFLYFAKVSKSFAKKSLCPCGFYQGIFIWAEIIQEGYPENN
jgi:hypothetical protein